MSLLRDHAGRLEGENINPEFTLIDDDHRDYIALTVGGRQFTGDRLELARLWAAHRLQGGNLVDLGSHGDLAGFAQAFEDAKRAECLLDLDDLVVYGSEILDKHPDVAAEHGRGRHLLVDEL